MSIQELMLPGAYLIRQDHTATGGFADCIYSYDELAEYGIKTMFSHHFEMSFTCDNTVRGFYIQDAPWKNNQLFMCTSGSCKVILYDLRDRQSTYLEHTSVILDSRDNNKLYFEAGIAFAVISLEEDTTLYCMSDNVISSAVNIQVSVFDDRISDELDIPGLKASALARKAPLAEELTHNYW